MRPEFYQHRGSLYLLIRCDCILPDHAADILILLPTATQPLAVTLRSPNSGSNLSQQIGENKPVAIVAGLGEIGLLIRVSVWSRLCSSFQSCPLGTWTFCRYWNCSQRCRILRPKPLLVFACWFGARGWHRGSTRRPQSCTGTVQFEGYGIQRSVQ